MTPEPEPSNDRTTAEVAEHFGSAWLAAADRVEAQLAAAFTRRSSPRRSDGR